MGDQQLSPSIDLSNLGRNVSFYSTEQAQLVGKLAEVVTDDEEGRMLAPSAPARSSPLQPMTKTPTRSSSSSSLRPSLNPSQTPSEQGDGGDQRLNSDISDEHQHQSSMLSSSLSSDSVTTTTTTDVVVAGVEANLNSVITSLGLMQVGGGCGDGDSNGGPQQQQFSLNSNYQNLSPAIFHLLAQSQLPSGRWPMTGVPQQQQQQNIATSFGPTAFHSGLQPSHGWNGNYSTNLLSHSNEFSSPWVQNQHSRKAVGLASSAVDSAFLSKLQSKSPFPKNFPQSAVLRTGKTVSEESSDGLNQLNHDAEILKLSGVNSSILEMSGLSHSQDHLKGFLNWTSAGHQTTKRGNGAKGMSPYGLLDHIHLLDNGSLDQVVPNLAQLSGASPNSLSPLRMEHYSRKVFVGGLPPDIDEEEITAAFRRFGPLIVDWPHKAESKSYFPPKGYCFLLFQDELSVQTLIETSMNDDGKLFWFVSSPTMKDKMVQIRPWNLSDSDFVMDGSQPLDPRKTIFVGGVPRPLRAIELAVIMERLYGGVCYAGIDTDPELKYPKGAGRVAFSSQQSYIAAISARFVQLQHGEIDKRVEVKPYVLDDQLCDECQGLHCGGRFAPFFCANVTCLQYYCEHCWSQIHSRPGREFHKPLVKEGADRPRSLPFRWC